MSTRRVKSDDMSSVTSLEQLQSNIAMIGELQNKIEQLTSDVNLKIDRLKSALTTSVKATNDEIKVLTKACQIYFSANAAEFVPPGKKSARFSQGEIGTRTAPMSVTVKKAQEVIEELLKRELNDCVKVAKSVDKNQLKANREHVADIPGITFSQKEEFFIAPTHVAMEHVKTTEEQVA